MCIRDSNWGGLVQNQHLSTTIPGEQPVAKYSYIFSANQTVVFSVRSHDIFGNRSDWASVTLTF